MDIIVFLCTRIADQYEGAEKVEKTAVAAPAADASKPVEPVVPAAPTAADADDGWDNDLDYDAESADDASDEEEDEVQLTIGQRLRRVSPASVILTVGSIGSLIFLAQAMTSHTTPVPVLMSAGVISGLIFAVDVAIAAFATWLSARQGRIGRATLLALLAGMCAMISAGCLSGLLVMILVLNG